MADMGTKEGSRVGEERWLSARREGLSEAAQESIWSEVRQMWGISSEEAQQMAEMGLFTGLANSDPILFRMFVAERERQQGTLELIASENYVSLDVLLAQGSILTNKYAEGYPGERYYGILLLMVDSLAGSTILPQSGEVPAGPFLPRAGPLLAASGGPLWPRRRCSPGW